MELLYEIARYFATIGALLKDQIPLMRNMIKSTENISKGTIKPSDFGLL